eukprot:TRINITY_DN13585_c0_g1_i1.p1 TRINITY_DN13585_c0_g1~~TRINITY_DN13585_c0_g1_i1.p1  ORF type:complete len:1147 (-),score=456.64 TRINITY_DN13585_c0_g1_i1:134-3574(-)
MDLSKLLNGPGDVADGIDPATSSESTEDEENAGGEKEGQWRDRLYKRKGINFTTSTRENRTLRSMQVHERRKSSRQSHQIAGRGIADVEDLDVLEENEENNASDNNRKTNNKVSKSVTKKVEPVKESHKSKSRREKLAEYLDQKKRLDDVKRKMAKPAFRVGVIHHPVAPIGAGFHKPNLFSINLNSSKSAAPSTPKVAPRTTKSKPSRPVTTTASITGRVTRSKAAVVKVASSNTKSKQKSTVESTTTNSTSPTLKQPKEKETKPPKKARASFAPENFEFKMNIPLQSVVEDTQESDSISEEEGPKASTPVSKIVPKVIKEDIQEDNEKSPIKQTQEPVQSDPSLAPLPVTPESVQPRGRRRSRRISGVQPDPTLTQEDLCVTPAKRAKDRSASRDRRQSSQCGMCPGEHTCATPRATPRVSRMSTLPALSEADTSATDGKEEEAVSTRRSSRRASDVPLPVTEKKRTSRRSKAHPMEVEEEATVVKPEEATVVNTPDKLSVLARMAVDVPLPTTEKKGRSRRSLIVQPMEIEPISEADNEDKLEEVADTPVSSLSKSMDRASIESSKKEPTFKTPMKTARKAVLQSATKGSPSWITTERGSSKRKRKESPLNYSVPDLFENLEGSPLLAKLERKAMSNENISEADFDEVDEIPAAKQMKLDKDFEEIAVEESKQPDTVATGEQEHGIPYFRDLLVAETARITAVCDGWETKFEENLEKMSDDIQGEVRSVIGQGRLVMTERFSQFSGLVDNCEFKRGEKETTTEDLMGFWEMIYFQVEDVDKKFGKLKDVEANNWTEVVPKPVVTKKKAVKKPVVGAGPKKAASSGLKALIAAKRKAAEEAKAALLGEQEKPIEEEAKVEEIESSQPKEEENVASKRLNIKEMIAKKRAQLAKEKAEKEAPSSSDNTEEKEEQKPQTEERTFEGGFFSVKSPVHSRENSPKQKTPVSLEKNRRSFVGDHLRRSVLKQSARRVSGLVSPFVSQVARRSLQGSDISPYKDTQPSALFNDDMEINKAEDAEENQASLTVPAPLIELFDPIAPLSSPVTKTYSKSGTSPAAKQRQIDAFDQMVVGTSPKVDSFYLEPSTPMVNFTDNVELISFDSPVDPVAHQPTSPEATSSEPKTPATKSKIPVKTPARRSVRGTPK